MIETYEKTYDEYLNNKTSLLNIEIPEEGISAENITDGVFGAFSRTAGIEFKTDKANDASIIQSRNFVSGSTGWRIDSDGNAEFVSVTVSGYIAVGGAAADANTTGGVSGGAITTGTLDASVVTVTNLNATNISTGTLTGRVVRTSSGTTRVEMDVTNNALNIYENGVARVGLSAGVIGFANPAGAGSGSIAGIGTNKIGIQTGANSYYFDEAAFYPSTTLDLGTSTDKFQHLYLSGNFYATTGHIYMNQGDIRCGTNNTGRIGLTGERWNIGYFNNLFASSNIAVGGTVDGVDISAHATTASAHHSSTSNGLGITPGSIISSGIIRAATDDSVYLGTSTYGFKDFYFTDVYDPKIYRGASIELEFEAANVKCHRNFITSATTMNLGDATYYWNAVHYQSLNPHTPTVFKDLEGMEILNTIKSKAGGKINTVDIDERIKTGKGKDRSLELTQLVMATISAIKELSTKVEALEAK